MVARTTNTRRVPSPSVIQFAADVVVFGAVWFTALLLSNITVTAIRSDARSFVLAVGATAVTMTIMQRRGLYDGRPSLPRTDEISRLFVAVLGGSASVAVAGAFLDWHIGAWEIVVGGTLAFAVRTLSRGLVRSLGTELPSTAWPTRVVIVGTGHEAKELAELVSDHPEARFELAGVVGNLGVAERNGLAENWIGPTGRLIELMHQHEVSAAIVTATGFRGEQFRNITRELFGSGYDVHLTTGVSRMWEGRFDVRSLSHEPLIVMGRNNPPKWQRAGKRAVDIVGSATALIVASPIMLLAAACIWFEDHGPVTYTARRAGHKGTFFNMYKFRSMVTNADELKQDMAEQNERTGPLFKISDDPRITRVGRFIRETSIDELPQLFNVLRGDMSLVGPRPALPEEEAAFDEELRERFKVRPGITGLWQVEARSNAAFNAYRRLDLHYVENWNLGLDLRILLATAEQIVVTIALLPLRFIRRRSSNRVDGIAGADREADQLGGPRPTISPDDVVIDLRARNRARLVAAANAADDIDRQKASLVDRTTGALEEPHGQQQGAPR
ncbi:MAG: sugar transferase [Acidimicrobiia bacterium]|nr:sugar transferase [Acidimicrobiia bacterium]